MSDSSSPRQRRKDARPSELLDAAMALFVEKGFAATKSEEVAARAGVSKGTLYLYFPSKEELLKAVIRHTPCWPTSPVAPSDWRRRADPPPSCSSS
jgi:AcrR family transcriptional regulator